MRLTIGFHIDSVEFTAAVIAGRASLGGSESACVGLARALVRRGHAVSIFTTKLAADAPELDHGGVRWYPSRDLPHVSHFCDWDVFVALRLPHVFNMGVQAGLRLLWNQDLMVGESGKQQTMAMAWAYDGVVYVSEYHRKQWEGCIPELASMGWVTKNGYDPSLVPTDAVTVPHRIIHITRPERGLKPLLAMWPELKRRVPEAELHLCRYNSMYDAQGWGKVCAAFDEAVAAVNAAVGGITYLGELGKPALYRAIAESAVMWYPGIVDFAETSCVAAIEAQACGTPFVGSYKGALPETVPHGILIHGDAESPEYQRESIDAVAAFLPGSGSMYSGRTRGFMVAAGRQHVQSYTFDAIAAEWETYLLDRFQQRVDAQAPAIVTRLMHEDDHVAALALAREIGDTATAAECQRIIDGKDMDESVYAERAMDPRVELQQNPRLSSVLEALKGCRHVLDLACGNGTFALALAQADPTVRVTAVDYAPGNIAVAAQAAAEMGVSERITFVQASVYDFTTHRASMPPLADTTFDGVLCGEFLEHVANVSGFLSSVHAIVPVGARIVCTMPSGPFGELAPREMPHHKSHVHHYRPDDLQAIFGAQVGLDVGYLDCGATRKGMPVGHWIVSYRASGAPVGDRQLAKRLLTTRPYLRVSVGVLAGDTLDLRRALASVWPIADEIVLGDTGAGAEALEAICREFPRARVVPVGRVHDLRGGFSEARNLVLDACTGDWFFWIDTDEQLTRPEILARYLEGGVFLGYGLKQNHLQLDVPNTFDTPIRIFRRRPDIRFYGCVHEQPQLGGVNGDIVPSLQLYETELAHTGYLNDDIRRQKALTRNLPLLLRDQEVFPDRRLGKVLWVREFWNMGMWAIEEARGVLTSRAKEYLQSAIAMFEQHFADPTDKYYPVARPFYEQALRRVAGAVEVEIAFAAQQQGLKGRAKPERYWIRTSQQLDRLLEAKRKEWLTPFGPPVPIDVEPVQTAATVEGVAV